MKIALIADQHFDVANRFGETVRVCQWITEDIARREVGLILLGGDLFERRSVPGDRNAAAEWLIALADVAPVVGIYGNHEAPDDLELFNLLKTRHPLHFYSHPKVVCERDVAIGCLPWPGRAQLQEWHGDFGIEPSATVSVVRDVIRGLGEQMVVFAGPRVLLAHVMIEGARTDQDQPLTGDVAGIAPADLALSGAHFVACGHVHAWGQQWDVGGVPIVYAAAPKHTNFGEPGSKGYVVVTFDGDRLIGWERIQTPATPMVHLEGAWNSDLRELVSDLGKHDQEKLRGAEIRLRYEIDPDQRPAAKRAAEELRDRLLAAGAIAVKIEDPARPQSTARVPEIATAQGLGEKLRLLWKSRSVDLDEARMARLVAMASEVESDLGLLAAQLERNGAIDFERIALSGWKAFPKRAEFDIAAIDPAAVIIAVCGKNGSGKSTLMGMLLGAVYRECPGRGSLADLAVSRDATLAVTLSNRGKRYTFTQNMDAKTGKGEAIILDEATGMPVIKSTKVTDNAKWVAEHMPALSVVLATTFTAQGRLGLIDGDKKDRQAALLRALGVERYEPIAKSCGERARRIAGEIETLDGRIADERTRAGDPAMLRLSLEAAEARLGPVAAQLKAAQIRLRNAEAASADAVEAIRQHEARNADIIRAWEAKRDEARRQHEARVAEYDRLVARERELKGSLEPMERTLAADEVTLGREAELLEAEKRYAEIQGLDEIAQQERARLSANVARLNEAIRLLDQRLASQRVDLESLRSNRDALAKRAAGREEAEAARARLDARRQAVQIIQAEIDGVQADVDRLSGERLSGALDRVAFLRGDMETIRDYASGYAPEPVEVATRSLERDDEIVLKARTVPGELAAARESLAGAQGRLRVAERDLRTDETAVARLPAIEEAEADLAQVNERGRALSAEIQVGQDQRAASDAERKDENECLRLLDGAIAGRAREKDSIRAALGLREAISAARARKAELDPRASEIRAALVALSPQVVAAQPPAQPDIPPRPVLDPAPPAPDIDSAAADVRDAEAADRAAHAAVGAARDALGVATGAAARLSALEAEREERRIEREDWMRLASDLGRDGLQGLEISAAGPEISVLATDLLHAASGPRFTLRLITSREAVSRDGEIEDCDIEVLDADDANPEGWRPVSTFSGGERVILAEAFSIALTMYVCSRNGIDRPFFIRDEPSAALDQEGANRAYMDMVRRAAQLTSAKRILLVTHIPELQQLADARIRVARGTVTLER